MSASDISKIIYIITIIIITIIAIIAIISIRTTITIITTSWQFGEVILRLRPAGHDLVVCGVWARRPSTLCRLLVNMCRSHFTQRHDLCNEDQRRSSEQAGHACTRLGA